jgi:Cytochrome P460
MTAIKLASLAALALAGCIGDAVTAEPVGDYTQWKRVDTWGRLPGHGGDTYRVIYANDVARTFDGGHYPDGSILVKEIHDLDSSGAMPAPGALQDVAIMRRLGPPPAGLDDEGGWLFSAATSPGGTETHYAYCWESCHVDAPFQGAWFDYAK